MKLFDAGLPGHWTWSRVGDVYEVTRKPPGLDRKLFSEIPFAAMEAIPQDGDYQPAFTMKAPDKISSGTYFEAGDVLVAKITPSFENGKQALVRELNAPFGYATTEVIPLHPRSEQHDPRFLFFYLLHPEIRSSVAERMEGSTGRQRVPEVVLLDTPIPVISHQEQTSIADALELIKHASAGERACERAAVALKRAALYALFARGLRGEAQKETEIGPAPQSWDIKRLGAMCVRTETVDLKREGEQTIKYIDVSSVSRESLSIEATTSYRLKEAPGRARKRIKGGDVLFATIRPTLVRVAYVPASLNNQICSTAFCVIRGDGDVQSAKFLFYALQRQEFVDQLAKIESGASYPAVTDRHVKDAWIPVPGIEERREIVAILDAIDRKIDLHRRKRAVLDDLFKALLHKLMTGDIRVADLNLSVLAATTATETVA